jgi:bifunctional oligoribonuclease and PAP phosphatase NrnA
LKYCYQATVLKCPLLILSSRYIIGLMNLKILAQHILKNKKTLILSTHISPDGDGLGSEVALAAGLKNLNMDVSIFNQDAVPVPFLFLNEHFSIDCPGDHAVKAPSIFLLVDVNTIEKVGADIAMMISSHPDNEVYFIDHHEPSMYIDKAGYYIDENVSSTGEIIYKLLVEELKVDIDISMAESIYTAIISDTRSFRYSRTTSYSHYIAARLIEKGISPEQVQLKVFGSNTFQQMQMLGHILCNARVACDNRVAYTIVTKELMDRFNVTGSDTKGFINNLLTIRDIEIAVMFREESPLLFKVSMRSKGHYPIAEIAKEFGGGGHKFAATFLFKGDLELLLPKIMSNIEKMMGRNTNI